MPDRPVRRVLRIVLRRLVVLFLIIVAAAVSFQLYLEFDRGQSEPEESAYASVPDTGGPAKGRAETFSRLLRARGLACSDEKLAKVFSRGCDRDDFDHHVAALFLGPVDGTLGVVTIAVNYRGAADEVDVHSTFDDLVGDFHRGGAAGHRGRGDGALRAGGRYGCGVQHRLGHRLLATR